MKVVFVLVLNSLLLAAFPEAANAQGAHGRHRQAAGTKPLAASGGVEANTPGETSSKGAGGGAGWNGSYVGVNAGMGFGATAGSNVVVPFGTGGNAEK